MAFFDNQPPIKRPHRKTISENLRQQSNYFYRSESETEPQLEDELCVIYRNLQVFAEKHSIPFLQKKLAQGFSENLLEEIQDCVSQINLLEEDSKMLIEMGHLLLKHRRERIIVDEDNFDQWNENIANVKEELSLENSRGKELLDLFNEQNERQKNLEVYLKDIENEYQETEDLLFRSNCEIRSLEQMRIKYTDIKGHHDQVNELVSLYQAENNELKEECKRITAECKANIKDIDYTRDRFANILEKYENVAFEQSRQLIVHKKIDENITTTKNKIDEMNEINMEKQLEIQKMRELLKKKSIFSLPKNSVLSTIPPNPHDLNLVQNSLEKKSFDSNRSDRGNQTSFEMVNISTASDNEKSVKILATNESILLKDVSLSHSQFPNNLNFNTNVSGCPSPKNISIQSIKSIYPKGNSLALYAQKPVNIPKKAETQYLNNFDNKTETHNLVNKKSRETPKKKSKKKANAKESAKTSSQSGGIWDRIKSVNMDYVIGGMIGVGVAAGVAYLLRRK